MISGFSTWLFVRDCQVIEQTQLAALRQKLAGPYCGKLPGGEKGEGGGGGGGGGAHLLVVLAARPELDGEGDKLAVLLDQIAQFLVISQVMRVLLQVQDDPRSSRQLLASVLFELQNSTISACSQDSFLQDNKNRTAETESPESSKAHSALVTKL